MGEERLRETRKSLSVGFGVGLPLSVSDYEDCLFSVGLGSAVRATALSADKACPGVPALLLIFSLFQVVLTLGGGAELCMCVQTPRWG